MSDVTLLGAIGRGLAAGFVGTAAMTAWQLLAARLQSDAAHGSSSNTQPSSPPTLTPFWTKREDTSDDH